MPNRIPTPGVKAPAVRKSPSATPSPTAKPGSLSKRTTATPTPNKAEKMFSTMKASGNIAKDKEKVAKKTGIWPNGATN